jgi:hypothetical protein
MWWYMFIAQPIYGPKMPKRKGFVLMHMGNFIQGMKHVAEKLSPRKRKKRKSDDEKENVCLGPYVLIFTHNVKMNSGITFRGWVFNESIHDIHRLQPTCTKWIWCIFGMEFIRFTILELYYWLFLPIVTHRTPNCCSKAISAPIVVCAAKNIWASKDVHDVDNGSVQDFQLGATDSNGNLDDDWSVHEEPDILGVCKGIEIEYDAASGCTRDGCIQEMLTHDGKLWQAPSELRAVEALKDLSSKLQGDSRGKGGGYRDPDLDPFINGGNENVS